MVVDRLLLEVAAWLLTYALHSTVILALAWLAALALARRACRSARLRDALPGIRECLWKTALVGGIGTASVQIALGIDPFALRPALSERTNVVGSAAPTRESARDTASILPVAYRAGANGKAQSAPLQFASPHADLRTTALLAQIALVRAALDRESASSAQLRSAPESVEGNTYTAGSALPKWMRIALTLWAVGVGIGAARWFLQWNRLLRMLDDRRVLAAGQAREIFDGLVERSGARRVQLCEAPALPSPITLGFVRRTVCIPPRAANELERDELTALLAHEVAHARRFDPAWIALCRALEVVFFFQPLNRVCARWLEDEAEFLCDDWAVVQTGDRLTLAACLTEVAGWLVAVEAPRLVPAMAAPGVRLSQRVLRLVDENHQPDRGRRRPLPLLFGATCAAGVALLVPGVAAERNHDPLPLGASLELAAMTDPSPASDELVPAAAASTGPCASVAASQDEPPALSAGTGASNAESDAPQFEAGSAPMAAASRAPIADVEATKQDDASLEEVLGDLRGELADLRAELATRTDGGALSHDLDALDQRIQVLGDRYRELAAALELQALPAQSPFDVRATRPESNSTQR